MESVTKLTQDAEIMIEELGPSGCATASTPGSSTEGRTTDDCENALGENAEHQYRASVARAN